MRRMFWVDLEMTGLDPNKDKIIEVAIIITDLDLNVLETYHRIVRQPTAILEAMNDWCKTNHGKSGLLKAIPEGENIDTVEQDLIAIANRHYQDPKEKVVLCGNSVGMDKAFIDVHLPHFSKRLHYRVVDVTSFKEIFKSKYKIKFEKKKGHRALDDIHESIAELQHYLSFIAIPVA